MICKLCEKQEKEWLKQRLSEIEDKHERHVAILVFDCHISSVCDHQRAEREAE